MHQQLLPLLKQYFGYDELRPAQVPVIESILNGYDTVAIMPTGGGKSMCYQLPALVLGGLTIVVSPLIALMYDQVMSLRNNGIAAAFLNSTLDADAQDAIKQDIIDGKLTLLYVSPEQLLARNNELLNWLAGYNVKLIAIDEAHCVSQWGHDFRPEYAQLSVLKRILRNVPIITLTATADQLTRNDIIDKIQIKNAHVHISSFDRPNITYTIKPKGDTKTAIKQLVDFIQNFNGESGIVYCLSRKTTEEVAAKLSEAGIPARPYHAGLSQQSKDRTYQFFMRDQIQVVCATIAFGMGIDKPDVRFVAHWNLPKSIENYYQETGRAGRDGLPSEALLLYAPGDASTYRRFIDLQTNQDSAHSSEVYEIHQKLQHDKLDRLVDFCSTGHCRRRILLQYFGEALLENCNNCDGCLNPQPKIDGTIITQKIISAIARTKQRYGIGYITQVLRGETNERIQEHGHDSIPTFGVMSDVSKEEVMYYINQLVSLGIIHVNYEGFIKTLALNDVSFELIKQAQTIELTPYAAQTKSVRKSSKSKLPIGELAEADQELFEQLRILRSHIAKEESIPAFMVFGNATLIDMARKRPQSFDDFGEVSGVGVQKQTKYWEQFAEVLKNG